MKIGIGVTTYKRPNECKAVLDGIVGHLSDGHEYSILCSVDHEDDGSYDGVFPNGVTSLFHKNGGIAANKNRLLSRLKDNDIIFIFEDDFCPIETGWVNLYIKAIQLTRMEHFNFILPSYRDVCYGSVVCGDLTLSFYQRNCGILMVMTKRAVDIVGAFDLRYGRYGFEHCDYTRRCKIAGLCFPPHHDCHPFIMESEKYFKDLNVSSTISSDEWKEYTEKANKVYMDFDPKRIFVPFPEGDY